MTEIGVTFEGLDELLRKADPAILNGPLRSFFDRATISIQTIAKEKVTVDKGHLRNSIATEVDSNTPPLWGRVGTVLGYAPFVEFGTRPHWPPSGALQPWAQRHGFPAGSTGDFLVRRAISQKGTRPQPYLVPALEESRGEIDNLLAKAADEIEGAW